jgi:phosphatidylserine/phosphatidylglycerophosphate/cardiolipin synthase-like enzyme
MHHKVFIIDRETVIFGSFNFSDSANRRNDENILIVHDPVFASFFVEEFEAVWQEAQ